MDEGLSAFLSEQGLPPAFERTLRLVCEPLADLAAARREALGGTAIVGLCGAQGSGKSTIAAATVRVLEARGLSTASFSLDDVYLSREARRWLAGKVHPLLQVRGPPGTHDVALACGVLDALRREGQTPLPAFDKAADERVPVPDWRTVEGPLDVVLFEGWCVGAAPEPEARLPAAVNLLERAGDPEGAWRSYVNRQLAEPYQTLWRRLDALVLLQAPGFEVVRAWRTEQEHKLRARTGAGMTDEQVARFVQHYERLTRWILEEMPGRADWVVPLSAEREPFPSTP